MNENELNRLLKLSQKTGDTLIIAGENMVKSVVILPVEKYEMLVDDFVSVGESDASSVSSPSIAQEEVWNEGVSEEEVLSELVDLPTETDLPEPSSSVNVPEVQSEQVPAQGIEERFYLEPIE